MNAVLIVVLVGALIILVGNTMIAIAFLRSRGDHLKSLGDRDAEARDELHRRVQDLTARRK